MDTIAVLCCNMLAVIELAQLLSGALDDNFHVSRNLASLLFCLISKSHTVRYQLNFMNNLKAIALCEKKLSSEKNSFTKKKNVEKNPIMKSEQIIKMKKIIFEKLKL